MSVIWVRGAVTNMQMKFQCTKTALKHTACFLLWFLIVKTSDCYIKTSSWCLWSPNISIRQKESAVPSVHSCSFFSVIGMERQWCHSILMHHIPGSMELWVKGGAAWCLRSVLSMTQAQRNRVCECERALKSSNEPRRFFCSNGTETRWTANVHWEGVYTGLKKDNSILFPHFSCLKRLARLG